MASSSVASAEDVREYELMVILPPDIVEAEVKTRVQAIKDAIKEHGKLLHEEVTPVRDFAYRIGKHHRGTYATFHFSFPASQVVTFEKEVKIEVGVLRHLLVVCPPHYVFRGVLEYEKDAEAMREREMEERKAQEAQAEEAKTARHAAYRARTEKPEAARAGEKMPASSVTPVPVESAKVSSGEKSDTIASDQKADLSKVDAQLKAILENPDISI